jgi:hypothetical protein
VAVPEAERIGPLVIEDDAMPTYRRAYAKLYTEVAAAGASPVDIGKHAQHSSFEVTNKHYIVPNIETSRRVARLRVALREQSKKDAG